MDPTLQGALIAVGGTVLGAVMGHFSAWFVEARRLKAAVALEGRERIAERDREVRARADAQADHALKLLIALDHQLKRRRAILGHSVWPVQPQDRAEAKALLAQIEAAALYLQQPARRHVAAVPEYFPDLDEIAYRVLSTSSIAIANDLIDNAIEMIGRYLRGEAVDDALPPKLARLKAALVELGEIHEADMLQQIEWAEEAEREREEQGMAGEDSNPNQP